jgi:hypothetical protein
LELADMNYTINNLHNPAGGYRMGDSMTGGWITFSLPKKPCWAHRMGVRLVLGWKWVDA